VILSAWLSFKSCDHSPLQELSQYALAEASEAVFTFLPHNKNQEGDNRQLWALFLGSNRIGDLFSTTMAKNIVLLGTSSIIVIL
jgi:hypothetical protein